jgi:hypothetical protein
MSGRQPQSTVVGWDYENTHVRNKTTCKRQKGKNIQINPLFAWLVIDPINAECWIKIQGELGARDAHYL